MTRWLDSSVVECPQGMWKVLGSSPGQATIFHQSGLLGLRPGHFSYNKNNKKNICCTFQIYDPNNQRFEVPLSLNRADKGESLVNTDYYVEVPSQGPFYITVARKSTKAVM